MKLKLIPNSLKDRFTRIDIYIIRKFLGTFFFSMLLIMSIVVVFDFNEKLDKFIDHNAPWRAVIVDYFLNFIPYFGVRFSPLFIFISVIYFTSKLAGDSEIIAMLSSGVSFNRLIKPYMFSAALLMVLIFSLNSFVIPNANKTRLEFENTYVKKKRADYVRNIQLEIKPGVIMYLERFDHETKNGSNFFLESYEDQRLVSRLTADRIRLDTASHWITGKYMLRNFDKLSETITTGTRLDTVLDVDPDEFFIVEGWSEQLTTPELSRYLIKQKERGVANILEYKVEYNRRFSFPFSCFILTIIGAAIASRKVKGGMGLHLGLGMLLSFSYILFDTISGSFAIGGEISPFIAVWIPNIIFGIIAVILYRKAPK